MGGPYACAKRTQFQPSALSPESRQRNKCNLTQHENGKARRVTARRPVSYRRPIGVHRRPIYFCEANPIPAIGPQPGVAPAQQMHPNATRKRKSEARNRPKVGVLSAPYRRSSAADMPLAKRTQFQPSALSPESRQRNKCTRMQHGNENARRVTARRPVSYRRSSAADMPFAKRTQFQPSALRRSVRRATNAT